jgi:ABC-2 type transport system permease protein
MTLVREFLANFTKIKRTGLFILHILPPVVGATLFFLYYAYAGYRIIPDVRWFFILLQIVYPLFVSIVVPIFVQLDRRINHRHNALGLVESRSGVYLGKLCFLLFLAAFGMMVYELCFAVAAHWVLGFDPMPVGSYFVLFFVLFVSNAFVYLLHMPIAFRFGSSLSVLLGISGTIFAGFFENAIGDAIWPFIPWEWGVRFMKHYFGFSHEVVFPGMVSLIIGAALALAVSLRWFSRWEGKVIQE